MVNEAGIKSLPSESAAPVSTGDQKKKSHLLFTAGSFGKIISLSCRRGGKEGKAEQGLER